MDPQPCLILYIFSVAKEPAVCDGSPEAGAEWNAAQRRGQHAHGLTPCSFSYRSVASLILPRGNTSAADPDTSYPYVFGPPGSGSANQRYGSGSGSFVTAPRPACSWAHALLLLL
jgi:hypothetical protein